MQVINLEIAAPEVLKTMVEGNPSTYAGKLAGEIKWFGVEKIINIALKQVVAAEEGGDAPSSADDGAKGASVAAVKFLKKTGLAELARQYSQIGTIVLITDKDLECVHLKDAAIKETLDVGGEAGSVGGDAFETLLGGKPAEYFSNLSYAHSASYSTLMYK